MGVVEVSRVTKRQLMPVEVESHVPFPTEKGCYLYPFHTMNAGDSFFLACEGYDQLKIRNNLGSAANNYGRRHDKKFMARQVEGGVRCWRVE